MIKQFYIGCITEPCDGEFLVIGHDVHQEVQLAMIFPEALAEQIKYGKIIKVNMDGADFKELEFGAYPMPEFQGVEDIQPSPEQIELYDNWVYQYMLEAKMVDREDVEAAGIVIYGHDEVMQLVN